MNDVCPRCGDQDGLCPVCHPKGYSYVVGRWLEEQAFRLEETEEGEN